jgi:quinoprotein glucose dehydrogenase
VQIVAAPAVIGQTVIVGSSVADSQRADAASGRVHAFDARTGALKWTFDPIPGALGRTGGGNVWSSISGDERRDLVFLPTTSPSPDFFGGGREGDESLADSIVALRASTGKKIWSFQTVHHDLWDFDVPAAPALFSLHRDHVTIPALAFATKQGFLFVLDEQTGRPLYPVIERPVPQSDVPGERTSPTQPFSNLPVLAPQSFDARNAFGVLGFDQEACRRALSNARNDGLFTPPSIRGTVYVPTTGGGANWGGVAIEPTANRLVVNTTSAVELIKLIPRASYIAGGARLAEGSAPQNSAPYAVKRGAVLSPLGMPCNPPPWGLLSAIDLDTGKLAWRRTLGTTSSLAPAGIALPWGTPNIGGPLVTGAGLVLIAATMEQRLRAIDIRTGEELWAGDLPASAQASPMTYAIGGRQFVVVAAGGHSVLGTRSGDYLVAFALPDS